MPISATPYIDTALTTLEGGTAPLTVAFLPSSLGDKPDSDSSSLRGQTPIENEQQREEAIVNLRAMKAQATLA